MTKRVFSFNNSSHHPMWLNCVEDLSNHNDHLLNINLNLKQHFEPLNTLDA